MTDRIEEIAKGVARLLDGQWIYNHLADKNWCTRAELFDQKNRNRVMTFSTIWNKPDRVCIRAFVKETGVSDEITVSQDRTIPAIAGDINRRLLPPFIEKAVQAESDMEQQAVENAAEQLKVDLLKRFLPNFRAAQGGRSYQYYFDGGAVELWRYNGKARVELDLDFDNLVRVLHFVYAGESNE
ncbi:MAG: hypothetical protein AAF986_07705 [Pseudomonadota bacterium]